MRIDTNSWHYKMNYRNYGDSIPKSLCPYFWSTVLSVIMISWLSALFNLIEKQHWHLPEVNIGIFNFLGKHRMAMLIALNGGVFSMGAISYFGYGNISGFFSMGIGAGMTIFMLFSDRIFKATSRTTYKIPDRNTQPSIFKEFVKAKHKSVCPMLEFVDVKKEEFNKNVKKIGEKESPIIIFDDVSFELDNLSEDDKNMLNRKYQQQNWRPNQVESEAHES